MRLMKINITVFTESYSTVVLFIPWNKTKCEAYYQTVTLRGEASA